MGLGGNRVLCWTLGLLAAASLVSLAGDVETTKLVTEDAPTVDPGRTELEFSYLVAGAEEAFDTDGNRVDRGTLNDQIFILKTTHGLRDGLDLAGTVLYRDLIQDDAGTLAGSVVNIVMNVKWQLMDSQNKNVIFSWAPGITAPLADTASSEQVAPGQVYWSLDNLLVLTVARKWLNLSADLGFALGIGDDREDQEREWVADIAYGLPFGSRVQGVAELNYSHAVLDGSDDSQLLVLTAGAVWNMTRTLRLDMGLQTALTGRRADNATGFTANFSKTF